MAVAAKYAYLDGYLRANTVLLGYVGLGLLLAVILQVVFRQSRLYDPDCLLGPTVKAGRIVLGITISFLSLLALLYLLKISQEYSRGWLLVWYGLTVISVFAARNVTRIYARLLVAERRVSERVAVYGLSGLASEVIHHLDRAMRGISVVGFFSDDESSVQPVNGTQAGPPDGDSPEWWRFPVSGGLEQLIALGRKGEIDKVVLALPGSSNRLPDIVSKLEVLPISILYCPELRRLPVPIQGLESLGDLHLLLVQKCPLSDRGRIAKTALDVCLASIALLLLAPVMLAIAIAIKLESNGPVLFRQRRNGYNDSVIRVLKFRTMTVTDDGPKILQVEDHDPRVTRVGRFLRRTSLDELPQIFTVLTGEMSLVGPRPHALAHGEQYSRLLKQYAMRHRVKPGITGWAQVNGFRGTTRDPELMRKRVECDTYYIENWSIWFDIEIMLRTIIAIVRGKNAY